MRGVGDYLLAKLVSSGVLHAGEPLLEVSIDMGGKLAPGRQPGLSVNAGVGARYQVARFGSPPSGLPRAWLGGRSKVFLRGLACQRTPGVTARVVPG
jgi:hypothetical protein